MKLKNYFLEHLLDHLKAIFYSLGSILTSISNENWWKERNIRYNNINPGKIKLEKERNWNRSLAFLNSRKWIAFKGIQVYDG